MIDRRPAEIQGAERPPGREPRLMQPDGSRPTVLFITEYDDSDAVLRTLRASPHGAIVLAVGRSGSPMANPVDLKRLALLMRQFPVEAILVSGDRMVRAMARAEGIAASPSLDGRSGWRRALEFPFHATSSSARALLGADPRMRLPLRTLAGRFVAGPVLLALLLASLSWLILYIVLPGVDVALYPSRTPRRADFQAVADPSVRVVDAAGALIPARIVEIEVSGVLRAQTTGSRAEPGGRASGSVTLRNLTAGALRVPRGTTFATASGIRFATAADVSVPPATVGEAGAKAAEVTVAVAAVDRGREGNVSANAITIVEGELYYSLAIAASTPTTGGVEIQTPYATESDRRDLRQRLLEELFERGRIDLLAAAAEGEIAAVWPLGPLNPTIVDSRYDAEEGQAARELGLKIRAKFFGTLFRREDAEALLRRKLTEGSPGGEAEFELDEGTLLIDEPRVERIAGGRAGLGLSGSAAVIRRLNLGKLKGDLLDMRLDDAHTYFGNIAGLSRFEIKPWPGYSARTGRLPFRINVRIETDGDQPA